MVAELSLTRGTSRNPPNESVQIVTSNCWSVSGTGHTLPLEITRKLDKIYETINSRQSRTVISERREINKVSLPPIIVLVFCLEEISGLWHWERQPNRNWETHWVEETSRDVWGSWGNWNVWGRVPERWELCRENFPEIWRGLLKPLTEY